MISALNDIKQGLILHYKDEPWQVMGANFMRTSQRKPVMQTKLKNFVSGKTLEVSFKPGDKIEEAKIVRKKSQYLYSDDVHAYFMSEDSYEQFSIEKKIIEEKLIYLKEGETIDTLFFLEKPITIDIPKKVEMKVISAPPGIRGDSAQGRVTKEIILENKLKVNAPLFVKEGDVVRVNTETGEYAERVQ